MRTPTAAMIVTSISLAMPAFACNSTDEPKVTIERDVASSGGPAKCDFYTLYFPSSFRGEVLSNVTISYTDDGEEAYFDLVSGEENDKSDRSIAEICVGNNLLRRATLTLTYTPPATPDGTTSMCASMFKYENLSDHVGKR